VDREREIVFDYQLAQLEIARLLGKVVDSDGHPVAGATIQGIYRGDGIGRPDIEAETAADGTFQVERALAPMVLYARTADGARAGVAHLDAKPVVVTLPVRPLAEAQGRLLTAQGEIVAGGRVRYGVHVYVDERANSAFQIAFGGVATSGADGRYTLKGLLLGEEYHVDFEVAEHEPSRPLTTLKPAKAEIINRSPNRPLPVGLPPAPRPARVYAASSAQTHTWLAYGGTSWRRFWRNTPGMPIDSGVFRSGFAISAGVQAGRECKCRGLFVG
jgi:hypothetical protein